VEESSDLELVECCRGGDREAFGSLVRRYQRVLFNVAYRIVGDPEDARDLAQTAFVKAFQKLDSYDSSYKFFSWLYRILVNETLNFRARRRHDETLDANPGLAATGGPQEQLLASELSRHVQQALMRLPVHAREVLVLRHFADLSYREMGKALSIPEKTVKSRLFEARRQLAAIWTGDPVPIPEGVTGD
jgi:RNA polymerase sigma-70 factor (ECF subfamily)